MTSDASTGPPLRIVHLITELDTGGAEMMLSRLVVALRDRNVENTVVSIASGGPLATRIERAGIRVIGLGMRPNRPSVSAFWNFVRLLRETRPHVLQTWLYHADLLGLVARTFARTPALVWNVRCSKLNFEDYSKPLRLVVRTLARASRWPEAVVCNSAAGIRIHEGLGYRPRRWVLIPNGVDPEVFTPCPEARLGLRRELGIDPQARIIGLLARLHPMKDHPNFLRAAARVCREHPDVHFLVAGRGVAVSEPLRRLVMELRLTARVHLQDERHDTPRVLAGIDVAVSSSDSGEGFPNMLIEAMASGVPCVATDVGDSATIIGSTGVSVPAKNPAALADGLLRVLGMSRQQREALGASARARVLSEFSLPRATGRYLELYQRLARADVRA